MFQQQRRALQLFGSLRLGSSKLEYATSSRRLITEHNHPTRKEHHNNRRQRSAHDIRLSYFTERMAYNANRNERISNNMNRSTKRIPYPKEITAYLDQFIVGQEHAKKILSVGVYQHYRKLEHNNRLSKQHNKPSASCRPPEVLVSSGFEQSTYEALLLKGIIRKRDRETRSISSKNVTNFNINQLQQKVNAKPHHYRLEKSNIILFGPSGSGKTYLTQKLAEILDVPIAMCDCTVLTQAGYVGDDVDTVIQKLLQNADGDVERTEKGIVFLDEFDKIGASIDFHSHGHRDVSGRGVQQALLKLVEGTVVKVKGPSSLGAKVDVDTSDILFIASGAFNNLDKIIAKRLHQKSVGFGAQMNTAHDEYLENKDEKKVSKRRDELLTKTDQSDLISFGMVPELIGRFPVYVSFHGLSEELLVKIMKQTKNSIISQAQQQFLLDNIQLDFTDRALYEIARMAVQKKTGARALRSIVENVLLQAKYDVPGTGIESVIIDENVVKGTSSYVAIKRSDAVKFNNEERNSLITFKPNQVTKDDNDDDIK